MKNLKKLLSLMIATLCISGLVGTVSATESELNTVKFISQHSNGEFIKGFEYELTELNTNKVTKVSLLNDGEVLVHLPDGHYRLKETVRPGNYKENDDILFKLPYENKTNNETTLHKDIIFYLKHKVVENREVPPTPKKDIPPIEIKEGGRLAKTNTPTSKWFFVGSFIPLVIIGIVLFIKRDKKEKDGQ